MGLSNQYGDSHATFLGWMKLRNKKEGKAVMSSTQHTPAYEVEVLRNAVNEWREEHRIVVTQRDELLAALERVGRQRCTNPKLCKSIPCISCAARAAIAKAKAKGEQSWD